MKVFSILIMLNVFLWPIIFRRYNSVVAMQEFVVNLTVFTIVMFPIGSSNHAVRSIMKLFFETEGLYVLVTTGRVIVSCSWQDGHRELPHTP